MAAREAGATPPEGGSKATAAISRRELALLLAAAGALQLIVWVLVYQVLVANGWGYVPWLGSDTAMYADRGLRVMGGQWPYTEFAYEYPPLSLLFFLAPPLKSTLAAFHAWFGAQMIAVDVITAILTTAAATRIWPGMVRPLAAAAAFAVAVAAAGAVAIDRFDGAVALVVAVVVLCIVTQRPVLGGLATGLGFALKLTPIVLLPLVLLRAGTRRTAWWAAAAGLAAAVLPWIPFLAHDPSGVRRNFLGMQVGRGLHIESVAASPYLVAQALRGDAVHIVLPSASLTIDGPGIGVVAALAPFTTLVLLVVVYGVVWSRRRDLAGSLEPVPCIALAAMLATLCGNKVLSPQHLLWILPLVALCLAGRPVLPKVAGGLLLCALVLTQIEYPGMYWDQVDLATPALLVIAARNALLVATFVVAVVALRRSWGAPGPAEGDSAILRGRGRPPG